MRQLALSSLYYFNKYVLWYSYNNIVPHVHGPWCNFLQQDIRFKQGTLPRSFFKTYTGTIGYSIWRACNNPNITILIAMNTVANAKAQLGLIREQFESNYLLRTLFPDIVPDIRKVTWSNEAACVNRTEPKAMMTFESIGVGGAVTSRHYDLIIEDDLVYAKKDDLTGAEIRPNPEDIQKAIGWHKLTHSLMADPQKSEVLNIGTRWATHDLIDWIRKNEPQYKIFEMSAYKPDGNPIWPERFGDKELELIRNTQGSFMFSTQYLNFPIDPTEQLFRHEWLRYYECKPRDLELITIVDLAGWSDKKGLAQNVIFTAGKDSKHHIWIVDYERGRFNPTQVLEKMEQQALKYKTKVYIEEVNYQAALRHFAQKRMEETGKVYSVVPLPFQQLKDAKDRRIRAAEPYARNGMVHCRPTMSTFVTEWDEYPLGVTCDLLDCLGFFIEVAKPQVNIEDLEAEESEFGNFTLESALKSIEERKKRESGGDYPYAEATDPFK